MSTLADTLIATMMTNTYTVAAALRRVGALRQAVDAALYQDGGDDVIVSYKATLRDILDNNEAGVVMAWGTDWLTGVTVEQWRTIEHDLETWLNEVPTMTVYVPVLMDMAGEQLLGETAREQFGEPLFLDLQVDPNTVGGCAFVQNGRYIDRSLAAQLNEQTYVVPAIIQSYDR